MMLHTNVYLFHSRICKRGCSGASNRPRWRDMENYGPIKEWIAFVDFDISRDKDHSRPSSKHYHHENTAKTPLKQKMLKKISYPSRLIAQLLIAMIKYLDSDWSGAWPIFLRCTMFAEENIYRSHSFENRETSLCFFPTLYL